MAKANINFKILTNHIRRKDIDTYSLRARGMTSIAGHRYVYRGTTCTHFRIPAHASIVIAIEYLHPQLRPAARAVYIHRAGWGSSTCILV